MKITALISILAFLTPITASSADAVNMDDASLRQRILGTWHSKFEWKDARHPESWIKARGEDHYKKGGRLVGRADFQYPDRKDRLLYQANWTIEGGYLLTEISESSGGFIKKGSRSRDKILLLSDRTMELQAENGQIIRLHKAD